MDAFHKALTFLTTPLTIGLVGLICAVVLQFTTGKVKFRCPPTFSTYSLLVILLWLYLWSTPLMTKWIGLPLEEAYPPITAESYPEADAISLLGGGMSAWEKGGAEMWLSADRVWQAAKLWKAGKAKIITITGFDAWASTTQLLQDFGVPTNAVCCITGAKNTENEAALIAGVMREGVGDRCRCTKVLLVTSAWHMRRAEWLFRKAGLDVIPAACDYEASARYAGKALGAIEFLPDAGALFQNTYLWKEWFTYFCYRLRDLFFSAHACAPFGSPTAMCPSKQSFFGACVEMENV